MDKKCLIVFAAMASLFLTACEHYSKTESGLRYKFLQRSPVKDLPDIGEYLQCHYSITNSEDSVIYSNFGTNPDRIMLTQATHRGGDIMEALSMMSEGDSARFMICADSFFLLTRREPALPSYVKPGSDIRFTVKMEKRLTRRQVDSLINVEKIARWNEEIVNINNYARKKGLMPELDTATGIRVQFHQKGHDTATRVEEGRIVTFHFIGKLMDGTEFYNSYTMGQPQTIKVMKSQFQPIGMYEMLIRMRQGEKATFILPYDLAFGAKGVEGMIPPYSTLVYELNILKVN